MRQSCFKSNTDKMGSTKPAETITENSIKAILCNPTLDFSFSHCFYYCFIKLEMLIPLSIDLKSIPLKSKVTFTCLVREVICKM